MHKNKAIEEAVFEIWCRRPQFVYMWIICLGLAADLLIGTADTANEGPDTSYATDCHIV